MSVTLKFPQISYKGFEFKDGSDIEITFHSDYLKYLAWSDNIFTDPEDKIPKETHWENIEFVSKEAIGNITFHYSTEHELFEVCCYMNSAVCLCVMFKLQKDALKFQKQLVEWRFENKMPEKQP